MKTIKTLIGISAVALFMTTAVADDTGKESKEAMKFDKMDRDHDGKLSKAEVKSDTMVTEKFAAVDQDSDGYISKSEYTAMMQSHPSRTMEHSPSDTSDYNKEP